MKTFFEIFKDKLFVTNSLLFFICYFLVYSLLLKLPFTKDAIIRTASQSLAASIVFGFALTSLQQNRYKLKKIILFSLAILLIVSLVCRLIMAVFFN